MSIVTLMFLNYISDTRNLKYNNAWTAVEICNFKKRHNIVW